ncbi:glycosyltransferase family 10 [Hymenobacter sp. ASUV-10]|uniref:Glycosyltransferase family 10 n=1 Tax=Hymenobacter aranciens TaxID=3063996 RepID=A0ABT9B7I5_9BACT|nr:glycosyltransferase family 10 [Hymenobacter sp. ASUV-10]MDO7874158.1 glycosyltransferase family 10 [Hymenobacter sp. ASUV-10]
MTPLLKATLFVRPDAALLNNGVFSGAPLHGMKSDMYQFIALRHELRRHGIELATQDIHPPQESALVLVLDQVEAFQDFQRPATCLALCLMLSEPPTYYPTNWDKARHQVFDRILTYDVQLIDDVRYFRYHYAIDFEDYPAFQPVSEAEFAERKLCMLAAASFAVLPPPPGSRSLLYERYNTLRWFSNQQPTHLDFYSRGVHPDTYASFRGAGLLKRWLPQFVLRAIVHGRKRIFDRVYRGSIPPLEKIEYVRRYKFAIAYENTEGLNGYLTEKLFDCLAAATVPVYLGDQLAPDLVPPDCYIDRRQFATHEELYQYLATMPYARYAEYVAAIQRFMKQVPQGILSTAYNTRLLTDALLGALPKALRPVSQPSISLSHG